MKEFEDSAWWSIASSTEGMFFWQMEGLKMNPIYGNLQSLHEEDIYVILMTRELDDNKFNHNLHIWVGASASERDVRHAERHAAWMDLMVRRRTPLHWERQGEECEEFLSCFEPVLEYLPGKYKRELLKDHLEQGENPNKVLFSLFLHKNIKAIKQVDCDMSSLNKRDPLILVTDVVYVVTRGSWSSEVLKTVGDTISFRLSIKALSLLNIPVIMLDKDAAAEDWDDFYKALGWEDADSFPEIPDGPQEKVQSQDAAKLYEILRNRRGCIYHRSIPFPLDRNVLDSKSLYILAKGYDDVCLWIGKNNQDRNKAKLYGLAKLREFTTRQIPLSKWPPWKHMAIVPEGLEPASFKESFHDWIGID